MPEAPSAPGAIAIVQLFDLPSPMAHALQIVRTAQALARRGIETHVFVRAPKTVEIATEIERASGRRPEELLVVQRFSLAHKGLTGLALRARLLRLARRGDVAFYGRQRRQTLALLRLGRWTAGARVGYEFHNLEHVLAAERGDERAARTLRAEEAQLVRGAYALAAISAPLAYDVAAFAADLGCEREPLLVPDAVDLDSFAGASPRAPGGAARTRERCLLVYAGSLFAHKGVASLLDALALLPERFQLRVVGGHPNVELESLRARVAADARLRSRVEFTGLVAPREVPRELALADLVVLPSVDESRAARYTSPLKLFEALASGAAVVATSVPSIASVLTDGVTAFLAPTTSAADLARAIERAAQDPERALRVAAAARGLADRNTWERRAERIATLMLSPRSRMSAADPT